MAIRTKDATGIETLNLLVIERFCSRYAIDTETGCWNWTAKKYLGYGSFCTNKTNKMLAHRAMKELCTGKPLPKGMVCDHLCNNKGCVNPDHIAIVTNEENLARGKPGVADIARAKTHCLRGHPLSGDNLVKRPSAKTRICKICATARSKREWQRIKAQRAATQTIRDVFELASDKPVVRSEDSHQEGSQ